MTIENILDAIGSLDEELLEDTDRIRQRPLRRPIPIARLGTIAATITVLLIGSIAAVRFSGLFSYKSADSVSDPEYNMYGASGSTDDQVCEDVNSYENGIVDGHSTSIKVAQVIITESSDHGILADVAPNTALYEFHKQVRIVCEEAIHDTYPIGTPLSVYYTDIDETTTPATLYATTLQAVLEP